MQQYFSTTRLICMAGKLKKYVSETKSNLKIIYINRLSALKISRLLVTGLQFT